ncbi:MAG TPA: helix-turn-helix domain-containing protein, partial [Herpetosiphonaceae bacterium]
MNDSSTEGRYTIGELAERADVTPRTIRYYTSEGVLPPPDLRGKYALYSEDHLRRLLLIKQLKDAFLPLQEIRARLEPLAPAEVADLLAREQPGGQPYPPPSQAGRVLREESSAADYISQLL